MSDYAIVSPGTRGQVFLGITEEEARQNLRRFKRANPDIKARLVNLPWCIPVEPRLRKVA